MFKILIDQDFDHDILRGLIRRLPTLDYITALDAGLSETEDPQLLIWAICQRKNFIYSRP